MSSLIATPTVTPIQVEKVLGMGLGKEDSDPKTGILVARKELGWYQ